MDRGPPPPTVTVVRLEVEDSEAEEMREGGRDEMRESAVVKVIIYVFGGG